MTSDGCSNLVTNHGNHLIPYLPNKVAIFRHIESCQKWFQNILPLCCGVYYLHIKVPLSDSLFPASSENNFEAPTLNLEVTYIVTKSLNLRY